MTYSDHFRLTDDLIAHLDQVFATTRDPFIQSRYTGFLAVSAVTVFELALKSVFCDFARTQHQLLASFTEAYFDRINGRIHIDQIKKDYAAKFGQKYVEEFKRLLEVRENTAIQTRGGSVKSSFANLITWRNTFAHEGEVPANATYEEVKRAYELGKDVLHCLDQAMSMAT